MTWHYTIPNIYTEKNFFYCIETKKKDFNKLVLQKSFHYKIGKQIKKNGGYRTIYKPDNELKKTLQLMYKEYLCNINLPFFVHCGVKNRSITTSLKGHNKYDYHLSLDIKSFFDEITKETLIKTLEQVKVPRILITHITDLCVEDNRLPQGFPTSSYLSSLVLCTSLEQNIIEMEKDKIKFSAYADDLLISADSEKQLQKAEVTIKEKLETIGLSLNDKRKLWHKTEKEMALGLNIHPFPSVRREKIKELQKTLYDKNNLSEKELKTIKGKISFYSSTNKNKLIQKTKVAVLKALKK